MAAGGGSAATPTQSNCCDQGTTGRTKDHREKSNTPNETNNGDDVNKDENTQDSPQQSPYFLNRVQPRIFEFPH